MNIEFQSLNPTATDDSYLIRFEDPLDGISRCIVVDCGVDATIDKHLGRDDELVGIIITHAHEDHISALPENAREAVPIYTSPDTATILETVFESAANTSSDHGMLTGDHSWSLWERITPTVSRTVQNALTPITEFTRITPSIDIKPIPAGHTPGAASFVFKLLGHGRDRYMLATGDFTMHSVASNPGLDSALSESVDIDVLFINSPMRDEENYGDTLTESLGSMMESAIHGRRVLVPASSLTGIHYAYWAAQLNQHASLGIKVTLAGLAAKIYEKLEIDDTGLTLEPTYNAKKVTEPGKVVISAPEVPREGGSGGIYDAQKNDPNSVVIQIKSGGDDEDHSLNIDETYRFLPHPTEMELSNFIDSVNPVHTIVSHGPKQRFKHRFDYTILWTVRDHSNVNKLYTNGEWDAPPWINTSTVRDMKKNNRKRRQIRSTSTGETSLPSVLDRALSSEDARLNIQSLPSSVQSPVAELTSPITVPGRKATGDGGAQTRPLAEENTITQTETAGPLVTDGESPGDSETREPAPDDTVMEQDVLSTLEDVKALLDPAVATGVVEYIGSDGTIKVTVPSEELDEVEEGDELSVVKRNRHD
jgi:putative mRNA 3-end processing factor